MPTSTHLIKRFATFSFKKKSFASTSDKSLRENATIKFVQGFSKLFLSSNFNILKGSPFFILFQSPNLRLIFQSLGQRSSLFFSTTALTLHSLLTTLVVSPLTTTSTYFGKSSDFEQPCETIFVTTSFFFSFYWSKTIEQEKKEER